MKLNPPDHITGNAVDTEDPQYKEYLKTNPTNPSWMDYQEWCGEQFARSINEGLKKHHHRNTDFLREIGQLDNMNWLAAYMKERPGELWRKPGVNDEYFETAALKIPGTYNSLMMYLSNDDFSDIAKDHITKFMQKIEKYKPIIENGEPKA